MMLTSQEIQAILNALAVTDIATGLSPTEQQAKTTLERFVRHDCCNNCGFHPKSDYHQYLCKQ